jgi:hypothetical protein
LKKKTTLISAVLVAALVGAVFGTVWTLTRTIPNSGRIQSFKDIKVYSDAACTVELTALSWPADMFRGFNYTKNMWVKNTGDVLVWVMWNSTNVPSGCTTYMKNGTVNWAESNLGQSTINSGAVWALEYKISIGPTAILDVDVAWNLNFAAEI